MYIHKIVLTNFKRFTDLTLDLSNLSSPPKLVLLIGANGSGKSTVFDAFELVSSYQKDNKRNTFDTTYYPKSTAEPYRVHIDFANGQSLEYPQLPQISNNNPIAFYGRSAFRQIPRLTRTGTNTQIDLQKDSDRPRFYIERDQRFENDIDIVAEKILREVFNGIEFDAKLLRERYITPINEAMERIFGEHDVVAPRLVTLIPPLGGKIADIRFRKGTSEFHYDLLSSGEKEVFNLLLNLFNRRSAYQDTIYFIDELDVHLNTALQYSLLKEITENWLPAQCQLWTASHSLGFIQYAKESEKAVILDFDLYDFDLPRTIVPQMKESIEIYEVAVPKSLAFRIFDGKQIVFCENTDDEFYNLLNLGNKVFIGVKDKGEVYRSVKSNSRYLGIMDRDYLSDEEIKRIRQRYPKLFILRMYCFENYLYHPDNIAELLPNFNKDVYKSEILAEKQRSFHKILIGLTRARNYIVLNDESIDGKSIRDQAETEISERLASDVFDTFYPLFDMKKANKSFLDKVNLSKTRLVQTEWFRSQIAYIFQGGEA